MAPPRTSNRLPEANQQRAASRQGQMKQPGRGLGVAELERIRLESLAGFSSASTATLPPAPFRVTAAGSSSAPIPTVPVHFFGPPGGFSPAPAPLLAPQGQFQPVQQVNPNPTADRCCSHCHCHQKKKVLIEQNNLGGGQTSAGGSSSFRNPMNNAATFGRSVYTGYPSVHGSNMHLLQGNIQAETGIGHRNSICNMQSVHAGSNMHQLQGNVQAEAGIRHKRGHIIEYDFFGGSERTTRQRRLDSAPNQSTLFPPEMVGPSSGGGGASCVTTSTSTSGGGGSGAVDAPSLDLTLRLSI